MYIYTHIYVCIIILELSLVPKIVLDVRWQGTEEYVCIYIHLYYQDLVSNISYLIYQYIKEGIEHAFKTVSKKFEVSVPFNCETKNLTYVVIVICGDFKAKYIG